jgi:hypothetical protein
MLITLGFSILLLAVQVLIILFSRFEQKKRRIFLVLDFLGITLLVSGLFVWVSFMIPWFLMPVIAIYFILYNLIFFKIVRRFVLRARAERVREEINDAVIGSLRSLAELDYKTAYKILEAGLQKHPSSNELKRLKYYFDSKMPDVTPVSTKKLQS